MTTTDQVVAAHDAMADEYDRLGDVWYGHLYAQLHDVLLDVAEEMGGGKALDAGCGTGNQAMLLAQAGFDVEGFDVSAGLLRRARHKVDQLARPPAAPPFDGGAGPTARRFDQQHDRARRLRGGRPILSPRLAYGDILDPRSYCGAPYDLIVCVGSVLSFVDRPLEALGHMARALRSGGRLVLEVEQRVSGDTLWGLLDGLAGGRLGVLARPSQARRLLARRGRSIRLRFPFPLEDGSTVELPLWLFSVPALERAFMDHGLSLLRREGVHILTNLALPSSALHRLDPESRAGRAVRVLAGLERPLAARAPFSRLGTSLVYVLKRG